MKIKSLLIGSMLGSATTSLVAVSGAHAADPIIYAEPEPMEYVRVCDVYGSGYFYIPGTETCLSINGYIWYQVGSASGGDGPAFLTGETPNYHGFAADRWNKGTRARVNLDARSETEWGTLRGFIRLQANVGDGLGGPGGGTFAHGSADPNFVLDQGFLELGGFRAGYGDSAWVVNQNSGVASYGSHTWGGLYYGYQRRQFLQYSIGAGDGFHATIALEHDSGFDADEVDTVNRNYMPDVVGVVGVNQGWGGAWLRAAYDDGFSGELETGWAAQAGVQVNVPNAPGSSLRVIGYYASAGIQYGSGSPLGALWQPEWSILGSYRHQFNEQFAASVGGQWFNDIYVGGTDESTGLDGWSVEAAAIWTPVQNFEVRGEYTYNKVDTLDGSHSGFLRFQRSF